MEYFIHLPPQGHLDGGQKEIWPYHTCTPEEHSSIPALKVADDTLHTIYLMDADTSIYHVPIVPVTSLLIPAW